MYIDIVKAVGPGSLIEYYPGDELLGPNVYGAVNGLEAGEIAALAYTGKGLLFNGSTAGLDLLSSGFSGDFNPAEGAMSLFVKAAHDGVWADAALRWLVHFWADASNYIRIIRPTDNDCLQFAYKTDSQNLVRLIEMGLRSEFHIGMSWSKLAGNLSFYINGEKDPTNFNLTSEIAAPLVCATLGTETSYGRNSWAGLIRDFAIYNDPLDPEKFKALASA